MNEIKYCPTKGNCIDVKGNIATTIGIVLAFAIAAYGVYQVSKTISSLSKII